jgi:hypothetical protein
MQSKFKQLETMLNILGFDIVSESNKGLEERKAMVELDECKTKTGDKYMMNDGGQ